MNCLIQKALRDGTETLKSLTEKYLIKVKRHGEFPNLVQLKYDQIGSPMGDPLVREARGIILDETSNWDIVARPFDKFFNWGEGHAASIDWNTAKVQEKLDGSLAIVYHYRGTWHMATSGTPDASGQVGSHGMTFKELFWKTWDELGYDLDGMSPSATYMFELMTKYNRVVVPHETSRITLIGVRHTLSGNELPVELWADHSRSNLKVEVVKEYPLNSMGAIEDSFKVIDGLHQEGYVVVDGNFNRVKVKHPQYVAYHHLVGSLSPKKILDAVRHGESSEVLTYFPEWKEQFEGITAKYNAMVKEYEDAYESIKNIETQKDFAIAAQKFGLWTAPLFAMRKSRPVTQIVPPGVTLSQKRLPEAPPAAPFTFRQYFAEARLESIVDILNILEAESVE